MDETYKSLGSIDIPFATSIRAPNIYIKLDLVSADVPVLLVLNVLDSPNLTADSSLNRLVKRTVLTGRDGKVTHLEYEPNLRLEQTVMYMLISLDQTTFSLLKKDCKNSIPNFFIHQLTNCSNF